MNRHNQMKKLRGGGGGGGGEEGVGGHQLLPIQFLPGVRKAKVVTVTAVCRKGVLKEVESKHFNVFDRERDQAKASSTCRRLQNLCYCLSCKLIPQYLSLLLLWRLLLYFLSFDLYLLRTGNISCALIGHILTLVYSAYQSYTT